MKKVAVAARLAGELMKLDNGADIVDANGNLLGIFIPIGPYIDLPPVPVNQDLTDKAHPCFRFVDESQKVKVTLFPGRELKGENYKLVLLDHDHIPDLVKAGKDESIFKLLFDGPTILTRGVKYWCEQQINAANNEHVLPFAIVSKRSNRAIGVTRYLHIDRDNGVVEIATWKKREQSSANTESKFLMLQYAFSKGFERVEFKVDFRNTDSRDALDRLGARFEGVRCRDVLLADETVRSSVVYSIVRDYWRTKAKFKIQELLGKRYTKSKAE